MEWILLPLQKKMSDTSNYVGIIISFIKRPRRMTSRLPRCPRSRSMLKDFQSLPGIIIFLQATHKVILSGNLGLTTPINVEMTNFQKTVTSKMWHVPLSTSFLDFLNGIISKWKTVQSLNIGNQTWQISHKNSWGIFKELSTVWKIRWFAGLKSYRTPISLTAC